MIQVVDRITEIIRSESRVIDLGCGDGSLLKVLKEKKQVNGLGLEINIDQIEECVKNDVPVLQMDIDKGLKIFNDKQFDVAILHYTMQEVRNPLLIYREMMRIANSCIVVFSNFAYWKVRLNLLRHGKMPVTERLPYLWYETPNIHLMSVEDLLSLCKNEGGQIIKTEYYGNDKIDQLLINGGYPNLGASTALIHMKSI